MIGMRSGSVCVGGRGAGGWRRLHAVALKQCLVGLYVIEFKVNGILRSVI